MKTILNKKSIFIAILTIILAVILFVVLSSGKKDSKENFSYSKIEKTDIRNIISSTGTLEAKGTVEISTQVSGTVLKVFVNYNDNVKKGQLLAILDTTLLEIAVEQCKADLAKSKSQYELTIKDFNNKEDLYNNKLISQYEFDSAKVSKEIAYSQYLTASANYKKASVNLQYAYIHSPIDGTVLSKNVEEGQTVAASLSAPTLFTIAANLDLMQINALVDESDISKIKAGQKVIFTVESYPDNEYFGIVKEIRLNPSVVSNVVNYTVIIDTQNKERALLPGMTTTIDFIINEKNNVFAIGNAALKFSPTDEMLQQLKKNMKKDNKDFQSKDKDQTNDLGGNSNKRNNNFGEWTGRKDRKENFSSKNTKNNDKNRKDRAMLWYMDENKELRVLRVKLGLSDDQNTEIVEIPEDKLNVNIISGIANGTKSNKNKTTNQSFRQGSMRMF